MILLSQPPIQVAKRLGSTGAQSSRKRSETRRGCWPLNGYPLSTHAKTRECDQGRDPQAPGTRLWTSVRHLKYATCLAADAVHSSLLGSTRSSLRAGCVCLSTLYICVVKVKLTQALQQVARTQCRASIRLSGDDECFRPVRIPLAVTCPPKLGDAAVLCSRYSSSASQ